MWYDASVSFFNKIKVLKENNNNVKLNNTHSTNNTSGHIGKENIELGDNIGISHRISNLKAKYLEIMKNKHKNNRDKKESEHDNNVDDDFEKLLIENSFCDNEILI